MKKEDILRFIPYIFITVFVCFYYQSIHSIALFCFLCFLLMQIVLYKLKIKLKYIHYYTYIAIALSLISHYPLMIYFYIINCIKQLYIIIINHYTKKSFYKPKKTYSYTMFILLSLLLFLYPLSYFITGILIDLMIVLLLISFVICIYISIFALRKKEVKKINRFVVTIFCMLYIILGATLPYLHQPEVSAKYKKQFEETDFYNTSVNERATIIEDNKEALIERLRAIEHAKKSIVMSTFDFRNDEAGQQMMATLIQKANQNINIQILVDGFNGTLRLENDPYFYALASHKNIEMKLYNPISLLQPYKLMSRMHDKYIIVDNDLYILGGRNTFNYFLGDYGEHKNYDRDVLVYNPQHQQKSLDQIKDYFNKIWNQKESHSWKNDYLSPIKCIRNAKMELENIYQKSKKEHPDWFKKRDYNKMTVPTHQITLLSNPTSLYSKEPTVFYSLTKLISHSKKAVIHTPYVIANDMMYESFKEMSQHSHTTLMTNSALNNGNPFGAVDYALNKQKLLDTKLNIIEYNGGISYHGKSITIDDDIAIVGSFNMDMKSAYQDSELMLVIQSKELNKQLQDHFETYHQNSEKATSKDDKKALNDKSLLNYFLQLIDPLVRYLF